MMSNKCNFRIGNGVDVHALGEGIDMYLGGIHIPAKVGFVAHSDGDVAIHSICDALLGCLALGDIGHHFPDTSEKWKGADSKELLRQVVHLIHSKGWLIANVDVTIELQEVKIAKYLEDMRKCLAPILEVELDCVSIKATTTEKLGFVGRSEGCRASASALIFKK